VSSTNSSRTLNVNDNDFNAFFPLKISAGIIGAVLGNDITQQQQNPGILHFLVLEMAKPRFG
jgi:hypothetical protein